MLWLRDNVWLLAAVIGGIAVSILASEHHSWREASARVAAGLFFATVFPGPTLTWLGRDPEIYGNATAGLFAMTGYALARMIVTIDRDALAAFIATILGRKK